MIARTCTYRIAHGCEIRADVYLPAESRIPVPAIVWLHGGALMCGSRKALDSRQLARYVESGYAVISLDYRLAPETKLPDIVEDVKAGFDWVRAEGARTFGIDSRRVASVGQSAGGYLALMTGHCVSPKPTAIVAFYGYCDIMGDWCLEPNPSYFPDTVVSREDAYAAVGDKPVSEDDGTRSPFYFYVRQRGLWMKEVCGANPADEPERFACYCPNRNVASDYPPTLLLHGTADSDVPYEQSVIMAEALARAGVEHELITGKGREHGFDVAQDDPVATEAFDAVMRFLNTHLGRTQP